MDLLYKELARIFPQERLKTRLIDRIAFASDAGFYHLVPQAVVQPECVEEIKQLFTICAQMKVPVVFRAGGSSLSGQSITDGVLVDIGRYWRNITAEQKGAVVKVQPGAIGALVNHVLKPYQVKIGPDPSSINTAMMGGIISNNASGMCCGVALNAYHTLQSIRFVLPNGKEYNTAIKKDYTRFEEESAELFTGLQSLRQRIVSNPVLTNRIREKYLTKNTVGYSLNALVDYDHPFDIFAHLLVGAEGTLAFIAEAVLHTVPDYPAKATALLFFPDMYAACSAIVPIKDSGAEMIELMDRASLRSVEHIKGITEAVKDLSPIAAALLVEYQDYDVAGLQQKLDRFHAIDSIALTSPAVFTNDTLLRELYWKVRKGMFPSVGAVRAGGTTVILEDVAFPVAHLADALVALQALFVKFEYYNAIIFGHAKDGNIHFVVTQSFNEQKEIDRYAAFMEEVVDLVVKKYDGALKAEHGTGRNMAPFVETEWGGEAYAIMKELKQLVDPLNMLNPGVIINEDKQAHIRHLKKMPQVEEEVDKCIECGFCEHKCPSRDITLTPRRRIVVRRAMAKMEIDGKLKDRKILLEQYQYDGLDTCAVDGLCATECPVDINTGDLVKRLRRENHSRSANRMALLVARRFAFTESTVKFLLRSGLAVNRVLGNMAMTRFTSAIKALIPSFPKWMPSQAGPVAVAKYKSEKSSFVYFSTCITRSMGSSLDKKKNVIESLLSVAHKAGIYLHIPSNIHGTCCGQPFSSKGFYDAAVYTKNKTIEWLWQETGEGVKPVVLDMSSCTYTLIDCRHYLTPENKERFDKMTILDSVDFLHDYILPGIRIIHQKADIALHPACSLSKMKNVHKLTNIAKVCAQHVHVPMYAGCCGMAGDRGMLVPELTKSATKLEAEEVGQRMFDGYYSSSKTCEMALAEITKKNYESIINLLDEVS